MPKLYSSIYIIKILRQHGFVFAGQRGSHAKYRKDSLTVIVPMAKKEIPIGTFHSICRQSGLNPTDFSKK